MLTDNLLSGYFIIRISVSIPNIQPHVSKAGAITALVFSLKLKQTTIQESLGAGKKHAASCSFLVAAWLLFVVMVMQLLEDNEQFL